MLYSSRHCSVLHRQPFPCDTQGNHLPEKADDAEVIGSIYGARPASAGRLLKLSSPQYPADW